MEPDRISFLPSSVINQILSFLSIREAVRTSILSNNWRNKWTTLPNLVFETRLVSAASQDPLEISRIIDHVLLLHSGPIKKFYLSHPGPIDAKHIDRWTLHLTGMSIEEFKLEIWKGQRYKIPHCLFSCQNLSFLRLSNCVLKPPSTFKGLGNLKSLELLGVTMTQDAFEYLISSCPLLENLCLVASEGFTEFNIHAPNLKCFKLTGIFDDISFEKSFRLVEVHVNNESKFYGCSSNLVKFFAHLSHIKQLHIEDYFLKHLAAGVVPVKLPSSCINLSYLSLHINFNNLMEISAALCVFRSSPNLQKLEIVAHPNEQTVASYCSEDIFSDWPTMQVRHVSIYYIFGIKSEIDFIRFVLLNSPVLQRMTIEPDSTVGLKLTKELLKFKRASGQAEVIYLDSDSA